jgi:uncharacterized protein DUF3147
VLIKVDKGTIRETHWYEYALRFLFGGAITAATGLLARSFGPVIAGLFLAFPAIFPATATLAEKHTREKKEQKRLEGQRRGREAAALEAVGAALGSIALLPFAVLVWVLLPQHQTGAVIAGATCTWAVVSFILWQLRRKM